MNRPPPPIEALKPVRHVDARPHSAEAARGALRVSVDGWRSPAQLQGLVQALRLGPAAVDLLQRQGLIKVPPRTRVVFDEPDDGQPDVAPPDRGALGAARNYAVELAWLMLDDHADDLLMLAGEIRCRATLFDWCDRCATAIDRRAGAERAEVFRGLVRHCLGQSLMPRLLPS